MGKTNDLKINAVFAKLPQSGEYPFPRLSIGFDINGAISATFDDDSAAHFSDYQARVTGIEHLVELADTIRDALIEKGVRALRTTVIGGAIYLRDGDNLPEAKTHGANLPEAKTHVARALWGAREEIKRLEREVEIVKAERNELRRVFNPEPSILTGAKPQS